MQHIGTCVCRGEGASTEMDGRKQVSDRGRLTWIESTASQKT